MLHKLRQRAQDEKGFTLIELLVVVVIIGVLVAIAVPVYLNYRKGAADKSAQSDLRGAVSAIEQFYTDNSNSYPATPTAKQSATFALAGSTTAKVTLSSQTEMVYVPAAAVGGIISSYKICSNNTGGGGKYYFYDSTAGGSVSASSAITSANFATCGP